MNNKYIKRQHKVKTNTKLLSCTDAAHTNTLGIISTIQYFEIINNIWQVITKLQQAAYICLSSPK